MGGGMNLIAAISIFTFGSLITAFTTFAHIAVLFAFFAFIYMGFGLLWLIDRIYIMINKIKNACPNPDCQASFLIPTYECPGCGEKHTNLVPSKYGILKRTCLCGTKLPTTALSAIPLCPVILQAVSMRSLLLVDLLLVKLALLTWLSTR